MQNAKLMVVEVGGTTGFEMIKRDVKKEIFLGNFEESFRAF